jgi:putative SOS response-associated peptidase YedK
VPRKILCSHYHGADQLSDLITLCFKCESVSKLPMFRDANASRRCIVPVDGFFEWRAIRGARAKQPYAIAMKDGSPFGLAGLWENWKPSNELVAQIHDRMPGILKPRRLPALAQH